MRMAPAPRRRPRALPPRTQPRQLAPMARAQRFQPVMLSLRRRLVVVVLLLVLSCRCRVLETGVAAGLAAHERGRAGGRAVGRGFHLARRGLLAFALVFAVRGAGAVMLGGKVFGAAGPGAAAVAVVGGACFGDVGWPGVGARCCGAGLGVAEGSAGV
jgi:hypothetical protein